MLSKITVNRPPAQKRAIDSSFPIEFVSKIAEHESWRKEVYRPMYYIHKWWARRLGSVFRAIIIASCIDENESVKDLFYEPVEFPDIVVYDPFMGSGTTIGEAVKLGCRVIGRDINPISYLMVSTALRKYSENEVKTTFNQIEKSVKDKIRSFYEVTLQDGTKAEALYYFWVKTINCPRCGKEIELFKDRIFAKNAMPNTHSKAKSLCPGCGAINDIKYNDSKTTCPDCNIEYNPQVGNIDRQKVTCNSCGISFKLIDEIKKLDRPLKEKMYAKMVLRNDGKKCYLPIEQKDIDSYNSAEKMLAEFWKYVPKEAIQPGYNTNQVLRHNYRYWYQMFNARQLVCLAILASEIQKIEKVELKNLFACLFSGMLEFNNMFTSFKGEGTGAVRHLFSHHILKPELTPLEANVWGTDKSSGSFSTLYQTRILRALEYKSNPFELKLSYDKVIKNGEKIYGLSEPVNRKIVSEYKQSLTPDSVYLSTGDSSNVEINDRTVDLIITDPPFFDNVHYSELADFFYVWLRQIIGANGLFTEDTTRSVLEVQNPEVKIFENRLASVFNECNRVLKNNGLLVFTYHHSRVEGWVAVYESIRKSGFIITHTHPVKSEMAVSVPIQQSNVPINYDLIIVCRKDQSSRVVNSPDCISIQECVKEAKGIAKLLKESSMEVSSGDYMVIFMGCILTKLPLINDIVKEIDILDNLEQNLTSIIMDVSK